MRPAPLRERVADRARLPLVSRTRIADSPSPSPAYASPNRNGAGAQPPSLRDQTGRKGGQRERAVARRLVEAHRESAPCRSDEIDLMITVVDHVSPGERERGAGVGPAFYLGGDWPRGRSLVGSRVQRCRSGSDPRSRRASCRSRANRIDSRPR